jgi:hypothetical protein
MKIRPRKCYPLKGKAYDGCWCYEIGGGDRVYYRPSADQKKAVIYYAGRHPKTVPTPPKSSH